MIGDIVPSSQRLPGLDRLSPFLRGLPMQFEAVGPTRVLASMELGPDQHTPWGVVHGGAFTTLLARGQVRLQNAPLPKP